MRPSRLAKLHAAVDRTSAEWVLIVPFAAGGYVVAGQDPARPLIEIQAIVTEVPESIRVIGKVTNTGHNAQLRTATHTIKFTSATVPYRLERGDRCVLLERHCRELVMDTIDPFGTARTIVQLAPLAPERKL